jgi:hypothetical protein
MWMRSGGGISGTENMVFFGGGGMSAVSVSRVFVAGTVIESAIGVALMVDSAPLLDGLMYEVVNPEMKGAIPAL